MTKRFGWLSRAGEIPARWDLRFLGWTLVVNEIAVPYLFDGRVGSRATAWRRLPDPMRAVAVGVDCGDERAAMLAAALGDALSLQVALGELAIRLTRLAEVTSTLPRRRFVGPMELDLLHRDARIEGRWLALHPREFNLLWRLADMPGERVSRERLLRDVWRLSHVPETNSLEVHVSRLRAKLAVAKAAWLVETDPGGGYRLARRAGTIRWTPSAALPKVAAM